uniref:Class II histocompatibility antigen, M alpha chain n=1 Tax=Aquila chrysaetos chrysaetos TaxID=223781 RepID=A0A663FGI4_AQUCH
MLHGASPGALHGAVAEHVAWGRCTGMLHGALHRGVGLQSTLHEDVARGVARGCCRTCCTGMLHGALQGGVAEHVARGCCTEASQSALQGDVAREHCTEQHPDLARGIARSIPLGDVARRRGTGWGGGLTPALTVPPLPAPAPPQARIISSKTSNTRASVLLTCHVWGFYPAEVTVSWLLNGNVVGPGERPPTSAIPNGDWTYQTRVTLTAAPTAGDTFSCLVQHVSLDEPLLEEWSPGLSPGLTVKVAVATVLMVLGLSFFIVGVYCYRGKPPAPGYTPLPGDTYPAGSI